jgi:hypothetical protein
MRYARSSHRAATCPDLRVGVLALRRFILSDSNAPSGYVGRLRPTLSVVVVAYDMERELPRTLRSLSAGYQAGLGPDDYEVVVIDNGSPNPVDRATFDELPMTVRLERVHPAPRSPVRAANLGLDLAQGDLIGLFIDGARLASPGLLVAAQRAGRMHERPIIASLGLHLGPVPHMRAAKEGYDQAAEDRLLADTGWESDGYRLFQISTLAGSSRFGWFGPVSESNGLFLPRALWRELNGLDERFELPGGGLANLDLFRRACALDATQLIVLLGEGTFHQVHGGVATSRWISIDEMKAEYESIRGVPFEPPTVDRWYTGSMPEHALPHLERSARLANRARQQGGFTPPASGTPAG